MGKIVKLSGGNIKNTSPVTVQTPGQPSTSALTAERANLADEALHAANADWARQAEELAENSPTREEFAYKDRDDLIRYVWSFVKHLQSQGYTPGALGSGFFLGKDPDGDNSLAVVDKLYVRLKAVFDSLEIRHLTQVAGGLTLSPAGAVINSVEPVTSWTGSGSLADTSGTELQDLNGNPLEAPTSGTETPAFRCWFRTDDGEDAIVNDFRVGDLVRCQTFNLINGQRYYWRRCVSVGPDYVDLSVEDCDEGSDIPKAGDNIATFGSDTNTGRSNVIELLGAGVGSPSITLYQGINSYSTTGRDKIRIAPGNSKFTGELIVYTEDGEMPLAQFTEELINLKAAEIKINGNTQITDADGNVIALFKDGKLRASIIDTDSLTARAIRTRDMGARTEISGAEQCFYDDDNDLKLRVHGGSLDPDNGALPTIPLKEMQNFNVDDLSKRYVEAYFTEAFPFSKPVKVDFSMMIFSTFLTINRNTGVWPYEVPSVDVTFSLILEADGPVDEYGDKPRVILGKDRYEGTPWEENGPTTYSLYFTGVFSNVWLLPQMFDVETYGQYRLLFGVELKARANLTSWNVDFFPWGSDLPMESEKGYTEIAADGAALRAGTEIFVKVNADGPELGNGNMRLKLTSSGLMISSNGGASYRTVNL